MVAVDETGGSDDYVLSSIRLPVDKLTAGWHDPPTKCWMRKEWMTVFWLLVTAVWAGVARAGPPTVVQYATYQTQGTAGENDSPVSFNAPTSTGNTLWVVVTLSDFAGAHSLTLTDTQGNTFTLLEQEDDSPPGSQTVAQFYASDIAGDAGTPDMITLSTGYENYRGLLIVEISGATGAPLGGSAANIQDGLAGGAGVVTSGPIAVTANQTPALMVALSMNTSGGTSDTGGSGFGAPAGGAGFAQIAQIWDWGVNLATFETTTVASGGSASASFNAPDADSYVTVAAVFLPPLPPVVTLSANPASIVIGAGSTLTWNATNATSCTASGGWSGAQALAGAVSISPAVTTTYGLTCSNANATAVPASTTITVNPRIPTATLLANTGSVPLGGSTMLTWNSANATACVASNAWSGSVATVGTLAVSPTVASTYALTCTNSTGTSPTSATTVVVTPAPAGSPAVNLSASAASLLAGAGATLVWSSSAASCQASDGWSGKLPGSGSLFVTPSATTTYSLVCVSAGAPSPTRSLTVIVMPPKPSVTLSATPGTIAARTTSTLRWAATNATTCAASGGWSGLLNVSGVLAVTPAVTRTYSIACSNGGATAVASVSVAVAPDRVPALTQYATHQTTGGDYETDSIVQFNSLTKAGDAIWVAVTLNEHSSALPVSITDNQGNLYVALDRKDDQTHGLRPVMQFYAPNIAGDSSTPDVITVHWERANHKGVVIAEIAGAHNTFLAAHHTNVQEHAPAGLNNLTSGNVQILSSQTPALVVGLSMNRSAGARDSGPGGAGGPASGSEFSAVAQCWKWGVEFATLEVRTVALGGEAAAIFSALAPDAYVTVSAVFH